MHELEEVDTNKIAKGLGVTGFSPLADFLRLHVAKALDDRVGNDTKLRNASNIEAIDLGPERHGYDAGVDNIIYDKINPPQNYYQDKINDDVAKEKIQKLEQDKASEGGEHEEEHESDTERAIALKDQADAEKLKAHNTVKKMLEYQAFYSNTDG